MYFVNLNLLFMILSTTIVSPLGSITEIILLLHHDKCYNVVYLGYVTSTRNMRRDWADQHLFTWLDEEKVFGRETYHGK